MKRSYSTAFREMFRYTGSSAQCPDQAVGCDVVIPYHLENLDWLKSSVSSVLNQSGARCIVHLIADGFQSSREDPALLFRSHPQVRLYRNRAPIGPYRSVHRIFSRLETDFLAIQDSDDIALPHRIRFSIDTLENEQSDLFCACMSQFVSYEDRNPGSLRRLRVQPVLKSGIRKPYCPEGALVNGTLVIRKSAFECLNGFMALFAGADLEFSTRVQRAGLPISISPEIVGLRRLHSRSLSRGGPYGAGSHSRREIYNTLDALYVRMVQPFDPAGYGGLQGDLSLADETASIGEV